MMYKSNASGTLGSIFTKQEKRVGFVNLVTLPKFSNKYWKFRFRKESRQYIKYIITKKREKK